MGVNFGRTASDYGRYRKGFPEKLFVRLDQLGVRVHGRRIADLGTGTGNFARELARRGARVTGIDRAAELLEVARELDAAADVAVEYGVGDAANTGLPGESFDVVTAGQCWWWFDESATLAEVQRLLVPSGLLVIAAYDWLPLQGNVVEATEALIRSFNPEWDLGGGNGLHYKWIEQVTRAGLRDVESFSFDVLEPFTPDGWRGRIRASAGVGASLSPAEIERFDAALAELLSERFPEDPLAVRHRAFAVVARA
ncbi:MAG: class I SAM-dependent methyltransferase [bacterium]|nr:class I SAM-dependent methyltransferase [bacterium]